MRSRPMPVSMFCAGSVAAMSKSTLRAHRAELVLHEDEVPDLEVAVLVGDRAALAAVLRAAVVVDLAAGAAGPGDAHVPVVVGHAAALDALLGHADDLLPELDGLVVVLVDGRPRACPRAGRSRRRPRTRSAAPRRA